LTGGPLAKSAAQVRGHTR